MKAGERRDYDVVRPALEAAGPSLDFWTVQIKPGKLLVDGRAGKTRILGLAGNLVSAHVTFGLFGLTLLRALQRQRDVLPRFRSARLLASCARNPGGLRIYRAHGSAEGVTPVGNQASAHVVSLAEADSLHTVPADSAGFAAGGLSERAGSPSYERHRSGT